MSSSSPSSSLLSQKLFLMGSGCGSVGTEVASNARGPWSESSHWQKFILNTYCIEKTKIEKKEAGNVPFKKTISVSLEIIHFH